MTIDDKIRDEKLQYDINREAAKISALSCLKIDKFEYLTGEELLRSNQRLIEQAKFTYSPSGKAFGKQTKIIEEQGRKQIEAITNQKERLAVLTNKDDHKDNYEEIFEELVKERFDEIEELNQNDLLYYFKGNTVRKRFHDFNNGIEILKKVKSGEMKLEEAKKLQNMFKSNLNKISRGRYKSEEQKRALETIKLLYESREAVNKLFNDYSSIASEAKYKTSHEKEFQICQHA